MKDNLLKRLTAVLLLLLLFVFAAGCEKKPERKKTPEGYAPDFTLQDLDGNSVSLADFRGKVVMIEFWATWCPPCKDSVPELNELHEKYRDSSLVFLSISIDDDLEHLKSWVEKNNVKFPVLFDDRKVNQDFGIFTIPTAVLVDKDGKLIKTHVGYAPGIFEALVEDVKDRL